MTAQHVTWNIVETKQDESRLECNSKFAQIIWLLDMYDVAIS